MSQVREQEEGGRRDFSKARAVEEQAYLQGHLCPPWATGGSTQQDYDPHPQGYISFSGMKASAF